MSASLRSPKPTGARRPAPGQMRASEPRLVAHERCARPDSSCPDGRAEQAALTVSPRRPASRVLALEPRPTEHGHSGQQELDVLGKHTKQPTPAGGVERPGIRPTVPESGVAVRACQPRRAPGSPDRQTEQGALTGERQRSSGSVPSRHKAQSGTRLGRRRGVAGLVVVCVLALGVAACSVRDAKAEASASASASASAAVARAEKGIADANASATASREAALTPELRAKRDAALAEPAPAKPEQMNEESPEGAASSVRYFLELYRYAFMTGNTTELAAMSEDRCVFCKSVIDRANDLHKDGGWSNKWEQDITNIRYYKKLEGYNYNLVHVHINYGEMTWCHPGKEPETAEPIEGQELKFGIRYVNGRWMVGEGEVISK